MNAEAVLIILTVIKGLTLLICCLLIDVPERNNAVRTHQEIKTEDYHANGRCRANEELLIRRKSFP